MNSILSLKEKKEHVSCRQRYLYDLSPRFSVSKLTSEKLFLIFNIFMWFCHSFYLSLNHFWDPRKCQAHPCTGHAGTELLPPRASLLRGKDYLWTNTIQLVVSALLGEHTAPWEWRGGAARIAAQSDLGNVTETPWMCWLNQPSSQNSFVISSSVLFSTLSLWATSSHFTNYYASDAISEFLFPIWEKELLKSTINFVIYKYPLHKILI